MSSQVGLTAAGDSRRVPLRRPSIVTLTRVELRKMVDTRAGFWLLAVTALVVVGGAIALSLALSGTDAGAASIFQTVAFASSLILPIVGILLVTSEWNQRTALITFVLTPVRERVMTAKFLAGVLIALIAAAIAGGVSLLTGSLLGSGNDLTVQVFGQGALLLVIATSIGVSLGLALRNSPLAIVTYFVGPIIVGIVGSFSGNLAEYASWLDQSALSGLVETTTEWDRVGVTVLVWVVLPLVLGLYRLSRTDVD